MRAITTSRGTSPNHASGHKLKSGNESMSRTEERIAATASVRLEVSSRTRVADEEARSLLAASVPWVGVETASCIAGEFIKSPICRLKSFAYRAGSIRRMNGSLGLENLLKNSWSRGFGRTSQLKRASLSAKTTENVTAGVTNFVVAWSCGNRQGIGCGSCITRATWPWKWRRC